MSKIIRFPGFESLTAYLKEGPIRGRMNRRRKIEAITLRLLQRLILTYGEEGARHICRQKMARCVVHSPGIRWKIWSNVFKQFPKRNAYTVQQILDRMEHPYPASPKDENLAEDLLPKI